MDITVANVLLSAFAAIIVGTVVYIIRRMDTLPARKEFDMTIKHLEAEIGHNAAQLVEMKMTNKAEIKELKSTMSVVVNKFEESIKRLHDKLDEINNKIK